MSRTTHASLVLPLTLVIGLLVTLLLLSGSLGPEVATHWTINGEPDGFTSTSALPWMAAGFTALIVLPLGVVIARSKQSIISPRGLTALPAAMAMFIGVLLLSSVFPQVDLDDQGVRTFTTPWWVMPAAIVAGLVGAGLATLIAGRPETPPSTNAPASPDADRYPLEGNQIASWTGQTAAGRVSYALAALAFIGFSISAFMTSWWLLIPGSLIAMIILVGTNFAVSAGPGGVRVTGVAGFPTVTVPLDQIESVEAGSVKASSFGGWGLRKGFSGDDAVLTRSGPALVVKRTDGARLHITIDDPATPASILASLLDRRA